MTYVKPSIQESAEAVVAIQGTRKELTPIADSIDPNSSLHYQTAMAYEADE